MMTLYQGRPAQKGRFFRLLLPLCVAAFALSALAPSAARADELSDEVDADESVYAVQHRPIIRGHEFSASVGILPLDSLYKGLTIGVGYAYHFNSVIGWQIAHFRYSGNVDTPTVNDLNALGFMATHTNQVTSLLDSSVLFKVLSGKMVLGKHRLSSAEITAIIGPAATVFSSGVLDFGFNVGVGFRAYLSQYWSATLEVREYELFDSNPFKVNNVLDVSLGISLNLR
jgi:outer membrane beta-barrel protein